MATIVYVAAVIGPWPLMKHCYISKTTWLADETLPSHVTRSLDDFAVVMAGVVVFLWLKVGSSAERTTVEVPVLRTVDPCRRSRAPNCGWRVHPPRSTCSTLTTLYRPLPCRLGRAVTPRPSPFPQQRLSNFFKRFDEDNSVWPNPTQL